MAIISRAPTRIELCGESTDLPDYASKEGGFVINLAINKYSYIGLKPLNEGIKIVLDNKNSIEFPNLKSMKYEGDLDLIKSIVKTKCLSGQEIFLRNDLPSNTGMGLNASISTALLGAITKLNNQAIDKAQLSEESYRIGLKELGIKIGRQNHYASAFGGINSIEFKKDGSVAVTPLKVNRSTLCELEKHLVLVYIGKRINGLEKTREPELPSKIHMDQLKELAYEMKDSLESGNINLFGKILDKIWMVKKEIYPDSFTHYMDHLYRVAKNNGAIGGRVIGSGRGGHMLFYAEQNKETHLVKKLQENGARIIDFSIDLNGLEVWES